MAGLSSSLGPLGSGRGGVTGFVGGSASSVFADGGALVNTGQPDPAMYAYTDTAHIHAVTAVSGLGTFAYDKNGNMTQRVEGGTTYTQTFDVENRLVSVAVSGGGTTQYQYDANGQMLKKIAPDGTVTVYLGLVEYEIDGGVTETTSYYNLPGARVVRVNSTLSYVLTDHLGSSSVTLDGNGGAVGELRYYAYGETRISTGSVPTERLYTGQLRDSYIKLIKMGARWLDPVLGRFVSADTIVPDPSNPQAFNRYAYVYNRPLNYVDHSGHAAACFDCGGSSLAQTLRYFAKYSRHGSRFNDYYAATYAAEEALASSVSGGVTVAEAEGLAAFEGTVQIEHNRALNSLSQSEFRQSMLATPSQSLLGRAHGMGFAIFPKVTPEQKASGITTLLSLGAFIIGLEFLADEAIIIQNAVAYTGRDFSGITFVKMEGVPPAYPAGAFPGTPEIHLNDSFFSLSVNQQIDILSEELTHTQQSIEGGISAEDVSRLEDEARNGP